MKQEARPWLQEDVLSLMHWEMNLKIVMKTFAHNRKNDGFQI